MDEGEVKEFVDQAQATLEASPQMDEEATKFRLVVPFIELLGWDIRSTEVEPEHTVRMATGKTKVDFALKLGDTPVVFVEAKPTRSSLDEDSVAQLRSYMRQELEVDWGVVTNGKSFEVLTKGNDGRQEEIALIQFDLSDLRERPDLLEILSKESIKSGKSDEIATQIAQAGEAILHLQQNKEQVSKELNDVLIEEISASVPLDTEAQATDFVDGLISALEEQRRAIGTISSPDEKTSTPEIEDVQDATDNYFIKLQDSGTTLTTFGGNYQSKVMAEAVSHLIENYDLISKMDSIPYVPGKKNAVINDHPSHPDEREMKTYRELPGGYYLFTNLSKEDKVRYIRQFVERCGLEAEFEGSW